MPTYITARPCNCCGNGECCFPSPCIDLEVTFENAGSMTGTYLASWDNSVPSVPRWTFEAGEEGCLQWNILAAGEGGGIPTEGFSLFSGLCTFGNPSECKVIGGASTVTLTLTDPDQECDNCVTNPGDLDEAVVTIRWRCCYPEYLEQKTEIGDCPQFSQIELQIDCDNTDGTSIRWFYEDFDVEAIFDCVSKTLTLTFLGPGQSYTATDILLSSIYSSVVLDRVGESVIECAFPETITVQAYNCGKWCEASNQQATFQKMSKSSGPTKQSTRAPKPEAKTSGELLTNAANALRESGLSSG